MCGCCNDLPRYGSVTSTPDILRDYLDRGLHPNFRPPYGSFATEVALKAGFLVTCAPCCLCWQCGCLDVPLCDDYARRNTLLWYACARGNTESVKLLLGHGANPVFKSKLTNTTCVEIARRNHAPTELMTLIEKAEQRVLATRRLWAPTEFVVGSPTMQRSDIVGLQGSARARKITDTYLSRHQKRWALFLSHHQDAAADTTNIFYDYFTQELGYSDNSPVFLDRENLRTLHELCAAARDSAVIVIFLTKDIFSRPWCLAEISAALTARVSVVPVRLLGLSSQYEFAKGEAFLRSRPFDAALDQANPGAVATLRAIGLEPERIAEQILENVLSVVARNYSPNETRKTREAQMEGVLELVREHFVD